VRRHALPLLLLLAACQGPTDPPAPPAAAGVSSNLTSAYTVHVLGSFQGYINGINPFGIMVGDADTTLGGGTPFWTTIAIPPRPLQGIASGHYGHAGWISAAGAVLGSIDDKPVYWPRYDSPPQPFTPGGWQVIDLVDMSDNGTVLGWGIPSCCRTSYHMFRWTPATGAVDVTPGASGDFRPFAINNAGDVVGFGPYLSGTRNRPLQLWRGAGGAPVTVQAAVPDSFPWGWNAAINNAGQVYVTDGWGVTNYVWTLAGGRVTIPWAASGSPLSDKGRLAIPWSCPGGHQCGATARVSDLSSLQTLPLPPGFTSSGARAVNSCGMVAGLVGVLGSGLARPALWTVSPCDR
jgi:hypothetical protein